LPFAPAVWTLTVATPPPEPRVSTFNCDCVEKLLSHAEHGEANCALLDLSGQDLREPALRSRLRALSATLPLIALSARDDEITRRLAREVGARAFFRKPVDAAALLDSIGWLAEPDHPH